MKRAKPQKHKAILLLFAALPGVAGCGRESSSSKPEVQKQEPAYEKTFAGGPVSLGVRLDRTQINLAGRVRLELQLEVEEGFEADFPEYLPEDFTNLAVVDIEGPKVISEPSPEAPGSDLGQGGKGGKRPVKVSRKVLVLEPDRSGEVAIEPLWVYFHRKGEKKESHFKTDRIPLQVEPLENVESLEVRRFKGIFKSPPSPPGGTSPLWWVALGAICLACVTFLAIRLQKRHVKPPPPVPPHETAWEELRELVGRNLVDQGKIEEFYVHLSGIMRRYIENRFKVRAPELTTQEFFEAAAGSGELGSYRSMVKEFLDLCDQVKFAKFQPEPATIQDSFDVVKKFIEETTVHGS